MAAVTDHELNKIKARHMSLTRLTELWDKAVADGDRDMLEVISCFTGGKMRGNFVEQAAIIWLTEPGIVDALEGGADDPIETVLDWIRDVLQYHYSNLGAWWVD